MSNSVISVIVPVYNSAPYITACVDSILQQTCSELQLILVDDGSSDGSSDILDRYQAADPRVTVIHQPNGGASSARNTGIEYVNGDWILFIDSDDQIDIHYCARMLSATKESNMDVLIARPYKEGLPDVCCFSIDEIDRLKRTCLAYDETQFDFNIDAPWGKLFKTTIIQTNNIRFPEKLRRSEDAYFCASVYEHCHCIGCLNWFGYDHIEREGSLCRKYTPDAPDMLELILSENAEWVRQYHSGEKLYSAALCHRVLPGIDECESVFFLHPNNNWSAWKKAYEYGRFLNRAPIRSALTTLRLSEVPYKQYKIRLIFYKLHLGWLFILLKQVKD